jgi:hypothetical protein
MFSETECIERREFTLLHKTGLGLVLNDLEQHLQGSTAEIDARDTNNRTPISPAADRGDLSAVTTLLRYNADPRIGSSCFATPLHFACCAQDPCCIQPLIDAGAQVDALTDWEQTPLIYAAAYIKDVQHANILLDADADKNWRDRDGIAPLAWAVIADNTPVAMALFARDVDIDSASLTGETALSRCVASNRLRILRELVYRRASPQLHMASKESLLHIAAKHGSLETLRILQGLDLHQIDRWQRCVQGRTAEEVLRARADISDELTRTFEVLLRASGQSTRGSIMTPSASESEGESESESDSDSGSGGAETWEDAQEVLGHE